MATFLPVDMLDSHSIEPPFSLCLKHRFMNPALRVKGLGLGQSVAKMFGVSEELTKAGVDQFNGLLGDPLRKF